MRAMASFGGFADARPSPLAHEGRGSGIAVKLVIEDKSLA